MEISMYKEVEISDKKILKELLSSARKCLNSTKVKFIYPDLFKEKGAVDTWKEHYKEIDKANIDVLNNIDKRGGVYAIFAAKPKKEWQLKYIGQTKSESSKQRIRSHLVWRNKKTKSGKSTGSKFDELQRLVVSGHDVALSFVEVSPESLRHYVEEELINKTQPQWNHNGTTLKGQKRSHMRCSL
jgi:hypothetical protein